MATKKPNRRTPIRKDPRMQQKHGLNFDNFSNVELRDLSDEEKAEAFLSKYLAEEHPFTKFAKYFENSAFESSRILLEIKRRYTTLVLQRKVWDEAKFINITNAVLGSDLTIGEFAYDTMARRIDNTKPITDAVRKRL